MAGPLARIRALDLSRVLAGPWATRTLADLGADVIKVERPGTGDDTRGREPPFVDAGDNERGASAYFLSTNHGKRSITIDTSTADGQALVREIAAKVDIVIENFKVGGAARMGLDYASLSAVNPRIVYCSVTGFGQNGPISTCRCSRYRSPPSSISPITPSSATRCPRAAATRTRISHPTRRLRPATATW